MEYKIKNKKGDVAITILVISIIMLCTIALISFYIAKENQLKNINSAFYIQEVYNIADSAKYSYSSGMEIEDIKKAYDLDYVNRQFIINRIYKDEKGIFNKQIKEMIKISYVFSP